MAHSSQTQGHHSKHLGEQQKKLSQQILSWSMEWRSLQSKRSSWCKGSSYTDIIAEEICWATATVHYNHNEMVIETHQVLFSHLHWEWSAVQFPLLYETQRRRRHFDRRRGLQCPDCGLLCRQLLAQWISAPSQLTDRQVSAGAGYHLIT